MQSPSVHARPSKGVGITSGAFLRSIVLSFFFVRSYYRDAESNGAQQRREASPTYGQGPAPRTFNLFELRHQAPDAQSSFKPLRPKCLAVGDAFLRHELAFPAICCKVISHRAYRGADSARPVMFCHQLLVIHHARNGIHAIEVFGWIIAPLETVHGAGAQAPLAVNTKVLIEHGVGIYRRVREHQDDPQTRNTFAQDWHQACAPRHICSA